MKYLIILLVCCHSLASTASPFPEPAYSCSSKTKVWSGKNHQGHNWSIKKIYSFNLRINHKSDPLEILGIMNSREIESTYKDKITKCEDIYGSDSWAIGCFPLTALYQMTVESIEISGVWYDRYSAKNKRVFFDKPRDKDETFEMDFYSNGKMLVKMYCSHTDIG